MLFRSRGRLVTGASALLKGEEMIFGFALGLVIGAIGAALVMKGGLEEKKKQIVRLDLEVMDTLGSWIEATWKLDEAKEELRRMRALQASQRGEKVYIRRFWRN